MLNLRKALAAITIAALSFASYDVPSAQTPAPAPAPAQTSITGATTDLLMSDDMADFIAHCPHEELLDEGDME